MKTRVLALCVVSFVLGAVIGVVVLTSTVLRTTDQTVEALESRLVLLESRLAVPSGLILNTSLLPSHAPTPPEPQRLPRGAVPFEFNGGTYYHVPLLALSPDESPIQSLQLPGHSLRVER